MLLLNGNMPDWLRNAEIIEENKVSDAIRDTVRNIDNWRILRIIYLWLDVFIQPHFHL